MRRKVGAHWDALSLTFAGTFLARDNLANFIKWVKTRGIKESVMFESDDLVEVWQPASCVVSSHLCAGQEPEECAVLVRPVPLKLLLLICAV